MTGTTHEDDVLAAAQAGDLAALDLLLRTHRYGVYRYGLQVCRTTEDAEDALQETLWAATRAIKTFRGAASSIASWMFTIIRRECHRLLDRHREAPIPLDAVEDGLTSNLPDPDATLAGSRRTELLAMALRELDPIHREVVLLRDIEELSAPEAAARLSISVDALKSRLHRARVRLREHVRAHAERGQ
jgi:RNA polymerase sigma-70 factor (ECF subfamily)